MTKFNPRGALDAMLERTAMLSARVDAAVRVDAKDEHFFDNWRGSIPGGDRFIYFGEPPMVWVADSFKRGGEGVKFYKTFSEAKTIVARANAEYNAKRAEMSAKGGRWDWQAFKPQAFK